MSAPVTTKAAENTAKPEDTKIAPQLGALEEDDEFEEFAAEGKGIVSGSELIMKHRALIFTWHSVTDWEETEEDTEDAHFWEDNWDDDDVEDDFSKQLRLVSADGTHSVQPTHLY
ncbi:hypothetical protein INT44_008318 [Umbelopsis vinacea]|uniref:26S proteasome complex subunit SEM1 n=1 Tax=Umbelopsis vinacea TaxID=44442 RepID=A0A8H7UFV8_9FUNG|nr:hypothetical protein INT44_008318 [Umbelopsis vinacea]